MDAGIYLREIAEQFAKLSLEAILIGNAAAAIQGAPVTTIVIDFLFRKTPANVAKLKKFAKALDLVIFNPLYPASQMFRLMRESDMLQVDFCVRIDGIRTYESLRSRATLVPFGKAHLLVASMADIIKSKRAAGRPKDLATLVTLEEVYAKIQAREKAKTAEPEKAI
ncbi:MAG: hypothetical protein ACKV2U_28365 [Bryobacteraceae bacterium]